MGCSSMANVKPFSIRTLDSARRLSTQLRPIRRAMRKQQTEPLSFPAMMMTIDQLRA